MNFKFTFKIGGSAKRESCARFRGGSVLGRRLGFFNRNSRKSGVTGRSILLLSCCLPLSIYTSVCQILPPGPSFPFPAVFLERVCLDYLVRGTVFSLKHWELQLWSPQNASKFFQWLDNAVWINLEQIVVRGFAHLPPFCKLLIKN